MGVFDLFGFLGLGTAVLFNDGMKAQDVITSKNERKKNAIKNGSLVYSADDKYHYTRYYSVKDDMELVPSQIHHQKLFYYKGTDVPFYNEGKEISIKNKEKAKQYGLKYYEFKNYYYLNKFFLETSYDFESYVYLRDIDDKVLIKIDALSKIMYICNNSNREWSNMHKMTKTEMCQYSLYWSSTSNKILEKVFFNWMPRRYNMENIYDPQNECKLFFDNYFNNDYAIICTEISIKGADLFLKANLRRKLINNIIDSLNTMTSLKNSINIINILNDCINKLSFIIEDINEAKNRFYKYNENRLAYCNNILSILEECLNKMQNMVETYDKKQQYEINLKCSELISMLYDFKY